MEDLKFKIKEESKENPLDSVIEKSGHKIHFTMREVINNGMALAKSKKGLEGQLLIEDAKCKNIENHHPFVKELTEEQRFTVHMYHEAMTKVKVIKEKVMEIDAQLEADRLESIEIEKQIGVAIPIDALKPNVEENTNENKENNG